MASYTTSPATLARRTSAHVTNVRECSTCAAIIGSATRPSGGLLTVSLTWSGASAGVHDDVACNSVYYARPNVIGLARTDARPIFTAEGAVESLDFPDGFGGATGTQECNCTDPHCGV